MKSLRVSLLGAMGLAFACVLGCQSEEPMAPPPPPPAATDAPPKDTKPARGSSKINEGLSSGAMKDSTQNH